MLSGKKPDTDGESQRKEQAHRGMFDAGVFRPKKSPLITQLKQTAGWEALLASLEDLANTMKMNAQKNSPTLDRYNIDAITILLEDDPQAPTKIFLLSELHQSITPAIVDAFKAIHSKPDGTQTLLRFYEKENGLLPFIVAAVGQEAVNTFVKTRCSLIA